MIKDNLEHLQQLKELFLSFVKEGLLNQTFLKHRSKKLHKMQLQVSALKHNVFLNSILTMSFY